MKSFSRWQTVALLDRLNYSRVIILAGARQCGKTTLARNIAVNNTLYRTLDDIALFESAQANPEGFVDHGDGLMIIDEVQRCPSLLHAIKKNVDDNQNYGRFLLTGSVNIQSLPSVTESLAGRVGYIRLRPLSMGEIQGVEPLFIDHAFAGKFNPPAQHYNKDDYLQLALIGGYPEAYRLPKSKVPQWHRDYIKSLMERDLKDIANIRRISELRALLQVLAAWSTKEMNVELILSSLSIKRPTAESYINALEALYLIDRIKAWTKTDYAKIRKKDKLLLNDTGLMASTLGWKLSKVQSDGECNGKLIETFVYHQLASIVEAQGNHEQIYYYRDAMGHEADFLIENADGDILAIEVKTAPAIKRVHFKQLKWLRSNIFSDRKFTGIVLYTGDYVLPFGTNLWAVPIGSIWS